MRLRHLKSSSVVVESGDTSVLCDPWLLDGAFYGSWAHYPPLEFEPEDYNHVDYIYVSHIHPDHFHRETMERLDSDIPVLIHDYATDFLKQNVERLGFDAIELPHAERTHLAGDLHINVLGADNCDPEACGNYFGCGWWMESSSERTTDGSTQIDSMGVFDDGENVVVNANDCRWPLSERACAVVNDQYEDIDLLLMQYAAANFYPQCMEDYTHEQRLDARDEVIGEMYEDAEGFVNALEPRYFMPFAGSYTLAGSLAHRNQYVASPTRQEAYWHFAGSENIEPAHSEPILLNSEAYFDLDEERPSEPYTPVDPDERREYIETELADRTFPHEADDHPSLTDLADLVEPAYEHMEAKRQDVNWESDTTVLLDLVDDKVAALSMSGDGYEITTADAADTSDGYVRISMDDRLLHRILRGPQYAHFNNAQIGSHIGFSKEPDVYERPLYYVMSFFHS
ncbi:MBL fold metallo-hydrolase [Halobacterium litoreum]|uniref:MBL fold metallo-hydrolase n=1 Tax=Halobacterium litoreum TaxID=2039234 RepID=A0ABD5NAX4_9EURY|nr:MBL fold metallo-hydrolase [Halobacterium litoreum]UHH14674.1 MBL fold metallo-hydrolase [Halobacterium litoreum]